MFDNIRAHWSLKGAPEESDIGSTRSVAKTADDEFARGMKILYSPNGAAHAE